MLSLNTEKLEAGRRNREGFAVASSVVVERLMPRAHVSVEIHERHVEPVPLSGLLHMQIGDRRGRQAMRNKADPAARQSVQLLPQDLDPSGHRGRADAAFRRENGLAVLRRLFDDPVQILLARAEFAAHHQVRMTADDVNRRREEVDVAVDAACHALPRARLRTDGHGRTRDFMQTVGHLRHEVPNPRRPLLPAQAVVERLVADVMHKHDLKRLQRLRHLRQVIAERHAPAVCATSEDLVREATEIGNRVPVVEVDGNHLQAFGLDDLARPAHVPNGQLPIVVPGVQRIPDAQRVHLRERFLAKPYQATVFVRIKPFQPDVPPVRSPRRLKVETTHVRVRMLGEAEIRRRAAHVARTVAVIFLRRRPVVRKPAAHRPLRERIGRAAVVRHVLDADVEDARIRTVANLNRPGRARRVRRDAVEADVAPRHALDAKAVALAVARMRGVAHLQAERLTTEALRPEEVNVLEQGVPRPRAALAVDAEAADERLDGGGRGRFAAVDASHHGRPTDRDVLQDVRVGAVPRAVAGKHERAAARPEQGILHEEVARAPLPNRPVAVPSLPV